jgi:2-dehydropantoate 2-reductase
MRFVIYGAGAIGGVVGARLAQAGFDVALIARGAHLEAIRRDGLTLETPVERVVLDLPAAEDPAAVDWRHDDIVCLATKGQDSASALSALRIAAPPGLPIVCMQNGVENERLALRLFQSVYGAVVMVPAAHLDPGVVQAYGANLTGVIDIGRYPHGVDQRCEAIASALAASTFNSRVRADVMRYKYAKLIVNLANAVEALCAPGPDADELTRRAREEGRAALTAAGIEFVAAEVDDVRGRWERMQVSEIGGHERAGSSSWQSLARGAGAIETDYLNGEIALLGRLHGIPVPVNAQLCALADRIAADGRSPGQLPADALLAGAQCPVPEDV